MNSDKKGDGPQDKSFEKLVQKDEAPNKAQAKRP